MRYPDLTKKQKKIAVIVGACIVAYLIIALALHGIGRTGQGDHVNDYLLKDKDLSARLSSASSPVSFPIDHVVDGDTFVVKLDGGFATIRLVGINTPETVDPRKPVQCFGPEASAEGHRLLDGATVGLQADSEGEGGLDVYGRVLAYAYLPDGTLYNKEVVEEGFAREYTFKGEKYQYQKDFKAAQAEAKEAKKGLWAPGACKAKEKETVEESPKAQKITGKTGP